MAQCEKCGTSGHDMREMAVDQVKKAFIGPCCVKADTDKLFEKTELQYGLEISSHMGVKAYASYGGLTLEFKKTTEDIQQWFQESRTTSEETMEVPQGETMEAQYQQMN